VPCPSLTFRTAWLSWVIPDGSVWATPGGSLRATADRPPPTEGLRSGQANPAGLDAPLVLRLDAPEGESLPLREASPRAGARGDSREGPIGAGAGQGVGHREAGRVECRVGSGWLCFRLCQRAEEPSLSVRQPEGFVSGRTMPLERGLGVIGWPATPPPRWPLGRSRRHGQDRRYHWGLCNPPHHHRNPSSMWPR